MDQPEIQTTGGAYVAGEVNTGGGDFIGRDKIIIHTRSATQELDDYLNQVMASYQARLYASLSRFESPKSPYKFLDSFDLEDSAIFFGREAAAAALQEMVQQNRLAVLHARSGLGKTSLLNAGLAPRLTQAGYLPVYVRPYKDPVQAIKQAIAPLSSGPWPESLWPLSLAEFLGLACRNLGQTFQKMVIMLDQFEEFFTFYPEPSRRQPFIDALGDCCDDKALPVRFVISLRSEYFADLADFQKRLPRIFDNHYSLKPMSRAEASSAIVKPIAPLGAAITYEPALLEMLLDDLARGEMELPHLQIICTRLYEALPAGQSVITLAAYNQINRAEGALSGYLTERLNHLPGRRAALAQEVLKALVSSEATKRTLDFETLALKIKKKPEVNQITNKELAEVLSYLVDNRLLHLNKEAGQVDYEMAHDYLAAQINKWLKQEDLVVIRTEELLERELANWRANQTFMSADHLEVIAAQVEYLSLKSEELELLFRSALVHLRGITGWWERFPDPDRAAHLVLEILLGDDRPQAWRLADALWPENQPLPASFQPLTEKIGHSLWSAEPELRRKAEEVQVFIGPLVRRPLRTRLSSLQLGLRLLVPARLPHLLSLAMGGALGGLVLGLPQLGLGVMAGSIEYNNPWQILRFVIINEPAMAVFGAFLGLGLSLGTVLSRGRQVSLEFISAAMGGALGSLVVTFYFLLLNILRPASYTITQLLLDRTLTGTVAAFCVVAGLRWALRWKSPARRSRLIMQQLAGVILLAGLLGFIWDILDGTWPQRTLIAIFLSPILALGLSLAEQGRANKIVALNKNL